MLRKNLDYLATLFYEAGVTKWAVSPGSRNAPIVAGFLRHGGFELFSFPDERVAAYAALGMSQNSEKPCGVICTSGTAVLNLYPAVCEAFYQRIPLIVLTADRPELLIDQWDGQTIRQNNIFHAHILSYFETPQDLESKFYDKELQSTVYGATQTCISAPYGPVHINVPLNEPIYSEMDSAFNADLPSIAFTETVTDEVTIEKAYLNAEISRFNTVLVVIGQMPINPALARAIQAVSFEFPILADITSNLSFVGLKYWQKALHNKAPGSDLKPDLLITMGLSVVSKELKLFLQANKPAHHWHITEGGFVGDPYQTEPETKFISPLYFIESLSDITGIGNQNYLLLWQQFVNENSIDNDILFSNHLLQDEFFAVQKIIETNTENCILQFGNSMSIRYASIAGNCKKPVYCNRGTSGIDGTLSTAVGYAIANPTQNIICILGDISFFYDSNALWTGSMPNNLKIIILNNKSGAIFNYIKGPEKEPKLAPYINTPHNRTAKFIAQDYGINYYSFLFKEVNPLIKLLEKQETQIIELHH